MHDRDVRNAILEMLDREHSGDIHTRIVEEMGIWSGTVRIDVAVINGEITGFELKSDRDTLDRLPAQANVYSRVFDRVYLVAGTRHLEKARQLVPKWWGIIAATGTTDGVRLLQTRTAKKNPGPDPYLRAQLLWKDEALSVLENYGLLKGYKSKPIRIVHERLAKELTFEDLSFCVREALKQRPQWLRQSVGDQGQMPVDSDFRPRSPAA